MAQNLFGFLSSPSGLIIWIIAAISILSNRRIRKGIIKCIGLLLNLIPATVLVLLGALALPFWRFALGFSEKLIWILPLDYFTERLLVFVGSMSSNILCKGHDKAFALQKWPEATYPYLYISTIPEDIRRPLYEDGKLIGGYDIAWLADRHFGRNAIREAIKAGIAASLLIVIVPIIVALWSVLSDIYQTIGSVTSMPQGILEHWPGQKPEAIPFWWWFTEAVGIVWQQIVNLIGQGLLFTVSAISLLTGVFLLIFILVLRQWQKEKGEPYELATKDAAVRWPYRAETRDLYQTAYRRQIELATNHLRNIPTFLIGKATGTFRARGDLTAPIKDQNMKLDQESLFQHVLIFGGTGEGKTTGLLKPLMKQLLPMKHFGMYVCDAKGVLWADAQKIARAAGRADDIVIIGTGPGQHGVDILAKLTPIQVAATMRSVLKQMGGNTGESFWPDMAANVLRHVLTIAQSYAQTDDGRRTAEKGTHAYSLWWAYQATLNETMLNEAIKQVRETADNLKRMVDDAKSKGKRPEEAMEFVQARSALYTPESIASISYIESTWRDMAKDTKTGIVANITQLLDGFSGSPTLRERFACGRTEGAISLSTALDGKVLLNALSNIEDGLPARLVSIFLKTSLYREARVREAKFKTMSPPKLPQDSPCVVLIDEVQEIVTADPESGLSDATFWNVARSTGLAGVFATQTIAALKQAIGEAAASNFLQQSRSKIFFRSEDKDTVEYACWCVGEFERGRVFDNSQRESIEYRSIIDKWEPFAPIDPNERIASSPALFFTLAKTLLTPEHSLIFPSKSRPTYMPDMRFIPRVGSVNAQISALQQSSWRAEDLDRQYRSQGNEIRQAITPSDMICMGRWHAYAHIQRAGLARQDIITIEHDFN
jgi:hypothetical protein